MLRILIAAALLLPLAAPTSAAPKPATPAAPVESPFTFERVMVPMRDGAKMETVIMRPRDKTGPLPILLSRTPYGVPAAAPPRVPSSYADLAQDGYIFVQQSMRGRFGSDGKFAASTNLSANINEATDAWDAIDWLVKNIPGNNGRVGMWGVSYPGLAAAVSLVEPHPALKAVSPQAAWADWWMNDDLHRWGALRLTYATDWLYGLQAEKTDNAAIPFYDRWDMYDWFLALGPVETLETRYLKGRVPAFTTLLDHPDYDAHWKTERWIDRLAEAKVATLNVAGFWDQEDPWGSWTIYRKLEARDPEGLNAMVAGPWNHGSWRGAGDQVGEIPIGRATGPEFRARYEAPFFRYWLHGKGERPRFEAEMLQSGSWAWKSYTSWPPKEAKPTNLYLHDDGTLSFNIPRAAGQGWRQYVSDPAKPVPYRKRPISPTYPCGEWCWWEAQDQRFVDGRPDVLSYVSAPLDADLTVTGEVAATIYAATTGTDADLIVKLIDVFPEDAQKLDDAARSTPGAYAKALNGYQWPIAMEVRRGRWLQSNEKATPLTPNQPVAWSVPLRDHDHVFKKGHRIMVQIQSSWFPVIDRNPQTFVPNIARAKPADFKPTTQRIYSTAKMPSHIVLPVMR
jgi:putative CocE/NonD family hydrolase